MQEKIIQICRELEKKETIKILFAVENGSRAWRMASKNSDYDVRFVFVRPIRQYFQIRPLPAVIEAFFNEEGFPCSQDKALVDMVGFDLLKFAALLSDSNPTTIEWLVSDIIYYGQQNRVFKEFAKKNFNSPSLYYHYKSMCRTNYLTYLKPKKEVTYKKYLYAYRGLINAKWVANHHSLPPIAFKDALRGMAKIVPKEILQKLQVVIKLKSAGKEKDIIKNIPLMDEYIEKFLGDGDENISKREKVGLKRIDQEIQRIILASAL